MSIGKDRRRWLEIQRAKDEALCLALSSRNQKKYNTMENLTRLTLSEDHKEWYREAPLGCQRNDIFSCALRSGIGESLYRFEVTCNTGC